MSDVFIKMDGISGESQDAIHRGEIDVISWHWKMAQPSPFLSGSGGGAGKATINDLEFLHHIDRSSPNLMRSCLTGRHIPKAVLTVRKAGGDPLEFLRITMNDVVITSVQPSVAGTLYLEHVSLSFSRVKQEYTVQDGLGGSGGMVTAMFDIKENCGQ